MKVGLIGLPGAGKTTLFNALTRSNAAVHAFGAQKDEVHLGTVPVPDDRPLVRHDLPDERGILRRDPVEGFHPVDEVVEALRSEKHNKG